MKKVTISIAGGSGYTGGELLRLLLFHPYAEIKQVTSERLFGKTISKTHPNLRKLTSLKFSSLSDLEECDVLFLCLPHGESMQRIDEFRSNAKKIIDLSADFRLNSAKDYELWYKKHIESIFLSKQRALRDIKEMCEEYNRNPKDYKIKEVQRK